jgi:hypothetical protein
MQLTLLKIDLCLKWVVDYNRVIYHLEQLLKDKEQFQLCQRPTLMVEVRLDRKDLYTISKG